MFLLQLFACTLSLAWDTPDITLDLGMDDPAIEVELPVASIPTFAPGDDDDDDDDVVVVRQDWWDPAWGHRFPVAVAAASHAHRPLVEVPLDFAAVLGDAFDPSSVRVVVDGKVVPSVFLDGFRSVLDAGYNDDVPDDGFGVVVFAWPKNLREGQTGLAEVYFASVGDAGIPQLSVGGGIVDSDVLDNGISRATFDRERGGLLDSFTLGDGPNLADQAGSSYGNGLNSCFGSCAWSNDAQDGIGWLEVVASTPFVGAVRAAGVRDDGVGHYGYVYTWWMFADRPELYAHVDLVTLSDSDVAHRYDGLDAAHGIRPFQMLHDDLAPRHVRELDGLLDLRNGDHALALGWMAAPAHDLGITWQDDYAIVTANDVVEPGEGELVTVPAHTRVVDGAVLGLFPRDTGRMGTLRLGARFERPQTIQLPLETR